MSQSNRNYRSYEDRHAERNKLTDIDGQLVPPYETEKAYRFYDGSTTCWLPKSQCEWDESARVMTMPMWLADDCGLI